MIIDHLKYFWQFQLQLLRNQHLYLMFQNLNYTLFTHGYNNINHIFISRLAFLSYKQ